MSEDKQYYQASWGLTLKVLSVFCVILMCSISVLGMQGTDFVAKIMVGFVPILILLGALPFIVKGYFFDGHVLFIRRLFWDTEVDLSDLQEIYQDPMATKGSLKMWGNGGMFSFTGWFWNKHLGFYKAYITDPRNNVVLKFSKRTIVATPDMPEEFIIEAKNANQSTLNNQGNG
jgi:hypothetical protein